MKTLPFFLFFVFLFFSPLAIAQEATTSPIPSQKKIIQRDSTTQKALLKARLKTFKNTVKAERVHRINTILETMNTTKTGIYKKHLTIMQTIITKLEQKISQADNANKDTTAAKKAIADAKTTLAAAEIAVTTQQQKEYILTISSENTVKNDIQTLRNTVQSELQATQHTVQQAKQSVITAITITKSLFGIQDNG
jgi:hypothetical protein